jgi:hypothetical protein
MVSPTSIADGVPGLEPRAIVILVHLHLHLLQLLVGGGDALGVDGATPDKLLANVGMENDKGDGWHDGVVEAVITPSEIIPYYRLNHSIWSSSDNKESSR